MAEFRVTLNITRCIDIVITARDKKEAEQFAKDYWDDVDVELDYGTDVDVEMVECLDEDE